MTCSSIAFRNRSLLLFAACLLFASSAMAEEGTAKLLVGHLSATGHAKLFVAKERGFFEAEGLDVELISYANSADGLAAVKAKKLDIGAFGTVAPLVYISAGTDIRIVGGIMGEDAYLVTLPENAATIKSPSDLRGKKIAMVRLSSGNAVLRSALQQTGLSLKTDVNITELSTPHAVIRAVKAKQADAGLVWGPYDLTAIDQGLVCVLATADLFPGHPCCRVVVMQDRFVDRQPVLKKFMRAILLAERFTQNPGTRKETIADIAKYVDLDKEHIERSFFQGRLEQASDPNVSGVLKIWDIMLESEIISSGLDPTQFIITEPYREALDSLLKQEPQSPYWMRTKELFLERN